MEDYVYISHGIMYQIIEIESPHEIWNTLKGLSDDEDDLEEHHLETKSSIYHNIHETDVDFFNNMNKYSRDNVAH